MAWIAVSGPIVGVLVGWYISTQLTHSALTSTATQQQVDQIREIDRLASSAMGSLRTYEKRVLSAHHLGGNGSSSTESVSPEPQGNGYTDLSDPGSTAERMPLGKPLDGKTLLTIKREANQSIQECTRELVRATAVLDEDTMSRARDLVTALVDVRKILERQETDDDVSSDAMRTHVSTVHHSRTRFLSAARERLGIEPLSERTREEIENLSLRAFAPSTLARPYAEGGIRPTESHSR